MFALHENVIVQSEQHITDGINSLTGGLLSYLQEIQGQQTLIKRHADTAAIHSASKQLEVYRMFASASGVAESLRKSAMALPSWNTNQYWKQEGNKWERLKNEIEARMERHSKQHAVFTKDIAWNDRVILIHAYKFEPDSRMKIELVVPALPSPLPELPSKIIADVLTCHEYLVPEYIAKPSPYYKGHDANFQSLSQYLSLTMPESLYASECFPPPRVNVVSSA